MNLLSALTGLWAIDSLADRSINDLIAAVSMDTMLAAARFEEEAEGKPYDVNGGVAVIGLEGPLMKQGGWMSWLFGGTSTADFAASMYQAANDPSVRSIMLSIDSPGGQVSGTEDAAAAVIAARKSGKPVYAHVDGMCCSAAYWIAAQCDGIYANQTAPIGSIGVFMKVADTSALMEKMGVKMHVVKSGEHKGAGSEGVPITDEQLSEFQRSIDATADVFRKAVATGRKMKSDKVASIADGRTWIGTDAEKQGLIDGVASRDAVLQAMQAYIPGRKAIKIAAHSGTEGDGMNEDRTILEQIKHLLGLDQKHEEAAVQTGTVAVVDVEATKKAHEAELKRLQDEHRAAMDAAEAQRTQAVRDAQMEAEHRSVVAGLKAEGRVTEAEVETAIRLRKADVEAFDNLMATRQINPLTPGYKPVDAAQVAEELAGGDDDAFSAALKAKTRAAAGKE